MEVAHDGMDHRAAGDFSAAASAFAAAHHLELAALRIALRSAVSRPTAVVLASSARCLREAAETCRAKAEASEIEATRWRG